MDAELKANWVKALRSGEYKQAIDELRNFNGFCCLGVLLDISGHGHWGYEGYIVNDGYDEICLKKNIGWYVTNFGMNLKQERTLINMNDGEKEFEGNPRSFAQIADYIEAKL